MLYRGPGFLAVVCFGTSPALLSVSCQVGAKFGTCTVVGLNRTLIEAKMFTFTLEFRHFIFNKCPIETYDGANSTFRSS